MFRPWVVRFSVLSIDKYNHKNEAVNFEYGRHESNLRESIWEKMGERNRGNNVISFRLKTLLKENKKVKEKWCDSSLMSRIQILFLCASSCVCVSTCMCHISQMFVCLCVSLTYFEWYLWYLSRLFDHIIKVVFVSLVLKKKSLFFLIFSSGYFNLMEPSEKAPLNVTWNMSRND